MLLGKIFGRTYRRPSWIVLSPAPKRDVVNACRGVDGIRFAVGSRMIAAFNPFPGEQCGGEGEIARELSRHCPGRHYALTLANVADDPDHGGDSGEAYEGGAHIGSLKVAPGALLRYYQVEIPNVEMFESSDDVHALFAPPPKDAPDAPCVLGRSVASWRHLFERFSRSDLSLIFCEWSEEEFAAAAPLLEADDAEIRLLAARILSFATAGASTLAPVRAALEKETDARVRDALREAEKAMSDRV